MSELFPLELRDVESRFRGKRLIGPVSLTLDGAGTCVVLGPNGAGKTTLLRVMHGTARLNRGTIRWACPTDEARHAQAFVFQRPVMLRRSVLENIAYPLRLRRVPRRDALKAAQDWAARVGLDDMLNRPAAVLSGGEQQKLAIARALINRPKLLFLDEPTASLDGRATREIEEILRTATGEGTRLILSTHDLGQARRLAEEVLFLLNGQIHESGPAQAFFDAPQTPEARAFLSGDIVE